MQLDDARFDTRAIHAGQEFDPTTGAVIPPVYLTSTYVQDGIGGLRNGYEYSRGGNPTRTALETQLAALEGGIRGLSFASGLAAEDALLRTVLAPGDHVVIGNDVYGGTHRLIRKVFGGWGIRHTTVDTSDLDAVRAAVELGTTKVLWVETPSNPLMKISDIAALTELGNEAGVLVVVDNTFASPALQQPIALGADVVDPLDHEVPRRALRRGRRRTRVRRRTRGARGAGRVHPVRGGRRLEPLRRVPHVARHQDARHPDAAAQRERAWRSRSGSRATPASSTCSTPGSNRTPGTSSPPARCRASAA